MLKRAMRSFGRIDLAFAFAAVVVAAAVFYAWYFQEFYIGLFMAPFFALGCARGKRPLVLIALSLAPAIFLIVGSYIKFFLTGLPLVTYDHYFLRRNVLMLAYNDWRVATALVIAVVATVYYFKSLVSGRGPFSGFERVFVGALVLATLGGVVNSQRWDSNILNWETQSMPPGLDTLVRSAQVPSPQLHLPPDAIAGAIETPKTFEGPDGARPDIFFVLQESTFHPSAMKPDYKSKTLFATNADQSGPLRIHTFAGGTWKSEFSVTTQMRPQEFGSDGLYVFHQLEGRIRRSIFTELKKLGYRTVVFYPVPGFFLNARAFYSSIGVDEFYDPVSLGISNGWNWKLSDAALYDAMLAKIGNSGPPIVAMMLTINQHGPHDAEDPFKDYLARFEKSDADYKHFLDALAKRGRPAGVAAFGDHQPEFTARFIEDHSAWYYTAYDIRCVNFACAKSDAGGSSKGVDVTMLTPIAMERFGFKLDDFSQLERQIFQSCEDNIERCAEDKRREFNAVFSRYFD